MRILPSADRLGWWKAGLDVLTSVVLLVAAGTVLWTRWSQPSSNSPRTPTLPVESVSLEGAPRQGVAGARVLILEFSDFQCPFCRKFAQETLPALTKEFIDTGRVALAFRHFPIESIHPTARAAAVAATCAAQQGKFWEFHDAVMAPPAGLDLAAVKQAEKSAGLEPKALEDCATERAQSAVDADLASARKLGLRATPTFLIGRLDAQGRLKVVNVISGARSLAEFRSAIEAADHEESNWFPAAAGALAAAAFASAVWWRRRRLNAGRAASR